MAMAKRRGRPGIGGNDGAAKAVSSARRINEDGSTAVYAMVFLNAGWRPQMTETSSDSPTQSSLRSVNGTVQKSHPEPAAPEAMRLKH